MKFLYPERKKETAERKTPSGGYFGVTTPENPMGLALQVLLARTG